MDLKKTGKEHFHHFISHIAKGKNTNNATTIPPPPSLPPVL